MTTSPDILNVENKRDRRYYDRLRASFHHRGLIAVHIAPSIEDALSLVAGLDLVEQELRGSEVILRFKRKSEVMPETTPGQAEAECKVCISERDDIPIGELLPDASAQWIEFAKHREHSKKAGA